MPYLAYRKPDSPFRLTHTFVCLLFMAPFVDGLGKRGLVGVVPSSNLIFRLLPYRSEKAATDDNDKTTELLTIPGDHVTSVVTIVAQKAFADVSWGQQHSNLLE